MQLKQRHCSFVPPAINLSKPCRLVVCASCAVSQYHSTATFNTYHHQAAQFDAITTPQKIQHWESFILRHSHSGIDIQISIEEKANLCQRNICSISGDTTVVILHRHQDVAIIAPVGGPWVLYQPVWLPTQGAVSHCKHSMVQVISGITWKT